MQATVIYSDGENLKTNRILRKWMCGQNKFVAIIEGDSLIIKRGTLSTRTKKVTRKKTDDLSLIDKMDIDTGITDLADQHDHYLYGLPKI
jgi:hypothetical protein